MSRKTSTIIETLDPLLVEKQEAARLYSVPPTVIDELIDSGELLVRTVRGHIRVRYDRLQSYARERDPEPINFRLEDLAGH